MHISNLVSIAFFFWRILVTNFMCSSNKYPVPKLETLTKNQTNGITSTRTTSLKFTKVNQNIGQGFLNFFVLRPRFKK